MTLTRRLALAAALAAPLAAAPAMAQTQITVQHALPANSHTGVGASTFKETFERLTNGRYKVVIQRNDNEREMVESVQIGTIDCTFTSTGPVGNFVPEVRIFDVPVPVPRRGPCARRARFRDRPAGARALPGARPGRRDLDGERLPQPDQFAPRGEHARPMCAA